MMEYHLVENELTYNKIRKKKGKKVASIGKTKAKIKKKKRRLEQKAIRNGTENKRKHRKKTST